MFKSITFFKAFIISYDNTFNGVFFLLMTRHCLLLLVGYVI